MTRKSLLFFYLGFLWLITSTTSVAFHHPASFIIRSPRPSIRSINPYNQFRGGSSSPPKMARMKDEPTKNSVAKDLKDKGIAQTAFYAVGATTSLVVSGTFFLALAYYRDALMVSFFIGSIANAITGKCLKLILNQERPAELETVDMKLKPGDKGMPSSHAMSLGFIGTFTGLTLPWAQLPILVYSFISLAYRIDIKLHTWQQIAVGFVVGSTNGYLWRHLIDGRNPFHINIMDWVSAIFLNEEGLLPMTMLVVPAIVGAIIVGSLERRIAGWLKKIKNE